MTASPCLICGRPVADYDPMYCCSGADCACRGMPTNPCLCSKECGDALFGGIGKSYEQRRIDAGIERWMSASDALDEITRQRSEESGNESEHMQP